MRPTVLQSLALVHTAHNISNTTTMFKHILGQWTYIWSTFKGVSLQSVQNLMQQGLGLDTSSKGTLSRKVFEGLP